MSVEINSVSIARTEVVLDGRGARGVNGTLTVSSASGQAVSSRVALAAIASPLNGQPALLTEGGREGLFVFDTSNLLASVTADPGQGVYVAPASAPTGSSGAWKRTGVGEILASWFGTVGDGVANDQPPIEQAITYAQGRGGGTVRLGPGTYKCTATLTWDAAPVSLVGAGASSQPDVGTVLYFPNSATQTGCVNPRNGPAGKGARSRARDFVIKGGGGPALSAANQKLGKGSGLLGQCNTGMFDSVVGLNLEGHAHYALSGPLASDPSINCNGSVFYCCTGADCGGAARAAYGVDSNQVIFIGGGNSGCAHNLYDNSFLGVVDFASLSEGSTSYDWRFGDVSRESRVYAGYREINTHANTIQFEAGGASGHKIDLRHAEGTAAASSTFTITDATANPYLNEVTILGVQSTARWGLGNGREGTVSVDTTGNLNVTLGKKIQLQDNPLTANGVLRVVAGIVQLEHGAGPMVQIASDGASFVLAGGKAFSSGPFDTPTGYKVSATQVMGPLYPTIPSLAGTATLADVITTLNAVLVAQKAARPSLVP